MKNLSKSIVFILALFLFPVCSLASFPQVQSITVTEDTVSSTSHAIAMPATVNAGDLLLVFTRTGGAINSHPGGWTLLHSHTVTPIYAKVSDGTEGGTSITIGTSSSSTSAAQVYRITGWWGTLSTGVERAASSVVSSNTPDPPLLNPAEWGAEDTLWITVALTSSSSITINSYPANYTNGTFSIATFNGVATARRELNAASEDPGTYTISFSTTWLAFTVAIRPAAAAERRRW